MAEPITPGRKKPPRDNEPIETSEDEPWSTPSPPSPTPCPSKKDKDVEIEEIFRLRLKKGRKRKSQFSPKKGKENQEPEVRVKKLMPKPTTARASIPSSLLSPEQHLQQALDSLD